MYVVDLNTEDVQLLQESFLYMTSVLSYQLLGTQIFFTEHRQ